MIMKVKMFTQTKFVEISVVVVAVINASLSEIYVCKFETMEKV